MTVATDPLAEPPVIEPGVSLASVSEQISSRILRPEMPLWWWTGFGIGVALLLVLLIAVTWLFVNGIGVWGIDIPVAWGLAIAEYVWWIALASGGTVISALFYLTRSPWRAATNRIAETMLLAAAASAGIMPILHLGRPGLFYWVVDLGRNHRRHVARTICFHRFEPVPQSHPDLVVPVRPDLLGLDAARRVYGFVSDAVLCVPAAVADRLDVGNA